MKYFLFLDDSQERHDKFDAICKDLDVEVIHVFTAMEAIRALKMFRIFDCAFLDHDLEDTDLEDTGFVVAGFIALHCNPAYVPKNVVIHSWNPEGADAMKKVLTNFSSINVTVVPFKA